MRNLSFALIACFLVNTIGYSQVSSGIQFEQGFTWPQLIDKAKAENKFIFVDCFATWCGPCREMDRVVYQDPRVGEFYNAHFISVKVQMDTTGNDPELIRHWYSDAHTLRKDHNIAAFPSYLFFSADGNIVQKGQGYKGLDDFLRLGADAIDKNKQYYTLLKKYRQGELMGDSSIKMLAVLADDVGENDTAVEIANDYFDRISEKELYTSENIWLLYKYTKASTDRGFGMFRDHADKIYQIEPKLELNYCSGLVTGIIYKEKIEPYKASKNGKPDWVKIKMGIQKFGSCGREAYLTYRPRILFKSEIEPELKKDPSWLHILPIIERQQAGRGQEFLVGSSVAYYLNGLANFGTERDCKNLIAAASFYAKKYSSYLNANALNTWAWTIFDHSADKRELEKALAWSDSCIKMSGGRDADYFDTYANLLYKIGRTKEAIDVEQRAVALAPENAAISVNFDRMKKREPTWDKP